jgi:hypothetical protein
VKREPLNQTDLKDGVDATLGGGGGIFWKMLVREAHRWLGGMEVAILPSMESLLESSRTFSRRCHRIIP